MQKINVIKLILTVVASSLIITSWAQLDNINSDISSSVDSLFHDWDNPKSAGCAISILRDGKIIVQNEYGMADIKEKLAITEHTVFNIASCSKQFTAMCILLLQQQEKLSIEDNIEKYLPEFKFSHPIKIKHLISHTSGIRDYLSLLGMKFMLSEKSMIPENIKQLLIDHSELNFQPGSNFLYSNSGYFILGLLVERVSGATLREYAEENIFSPLEMNNTFFHDNKKETVKNLAIGYTRKNGKRFKKDMWNEEIVGDHNLYSTISDMTKWANNLHDNKLGLDRGDLITKFLEPYSLQNGKEIYYASGLFFDEVQENKIYGHGGSSNGYKAAFFHIPYKNISIILLSNINSTFPANRVNDVASALLDLTNEEDNISEIKVSNWEGIYQDPYTKEILPIKYKNGDLYYSENSKLTSVSSSVFKFNSGTKLIFQLDSSLNQKFVKIVYSPYQVTYFYPIKKDVSDTGIMGKYEGVFLSTDPELKIKIKAKGGQLKMIYLKVENKILISFAAPLFPISSYPVSKDIVFIPTGAITLEYQRDSSNQVTGFLFHGQRFTNFYFKKIK